MDESPSGLRLMQFGGWELPVDFLPHGLQWACLLLPAFSSSKYQFLLALVKLLKCV